MKFGSLNSRSSCRLAGERSSGSERRSKLRELLPPAHPSIEGSSIDARPSAQALLG